MTAKEMRQEVQMLLVSRITTELTVFTVRPIVKIGSY